MSALQQSAIVRRSLQALRRVSEQEAIMTVGRLALTAADAASGLEALASVALRLSGLHGVEVRLQTAGQELVDVLEWHGSKEAAPRGAATGLIAANGREWGRMRILFEPRVRSLECPLRFVRILGQQVALMFNRLAVVTGNQTAKAAIRRLEQRLDMRKAVTRAAGILARVKNLTHRRALMLLLSQAREARKSPFELAQTTILSAETGHLAPILSQLGAA